MNAQPSGDLALERALKERDLYRRLLELGEASEVEPFLRDALRLVVGLTGAEQGYIEFTRDAADDEPGWSMAQGCSESEVEDIRAIVSRGIIAEALESGETIATDSAMLDDRFRERESVQLANIQAVLCAPVGATVRHGVVYLQRDALPSSFSEADREDVEQFARFLAPLADRLLVRQRLAEAEDPLAELRARYALEGIAGRSEALAEAVREALLAAPLDVNVLLTGESGTGKSQLASVIHANSARRQGPFVELNCAALPETLIESELFGARAGSHSEAKRDTPGKVAAAEGGTLFLDDIAELPLTAQAKLLQLLQSRAYYPLGATSPIQADLRVIAATHVDLAEAVREKRFREDLYYRLQVLPVRLPALRERREDIGELSRTLVRRACTRHDLPALQISHGAMQTLQSATWPGNVRELANALEAASIRATGEGGHTIESRHVFRDASDDRESAREFTFHEATRRFQRDLLERALGDTGWNVSATARRLGLARSYVYNLLQDFGLKRR